MNKENLLDSFTWKTNTGVKPDCEYVEIVIKGGTKASGLVSTFYWDVPHGYALSGHIIKYREITEEEWKKRWH